MNIENFYITIEAMLACGTGFEKALANAFDMAIPDEALALKEAFSEVWKKYEVMAKTKHNLKKGTAIRLINENDVNDYTVGTVFYRIDSDFRDFLCRCQNNNNIVGFEWDGESLNLGFILEDKKQL